MFTQCPQCHKVHSLTVRQLRDDRGMVRCQKCQKPFDGLKFISETEAELAKKAKEKTLPWQKTHTATSRHWTLGFVLGVSLLSFQIVYFEGQRISQKPDTRMQLEKVCRLLHCKLPVYRNLDEITVLQSSFERQSDKNYLFRVVIHNQAAFAQDYPDLQLSLLNGAGNIISQRIFYADDYVPIRKTPLLLANATLEIRLKIANLTSNVSGYRFDLM